MREKEAEIFGALTHLALGPNPNRQRNGIHTELRGKKFSGSKVLEAALMWVDVSFSWRLVWIWIDRAVLCLRQVPSFVNEPVSKAPHPFSERKSRPRHLDLKIQKIQSGHAKIFNWHGKGSLTVS